MTRPEALGVALLIGSLFGLAVFVEPPAFMVRLFDWLAGWFRRGRHHTHAWGPARPFSRERPTVDQLRARIEREAIPVAWLSIEPSVEGFRFAIRDQLAGIAG